MSYTWKQKLNVFAAVPYHSEIDPHSRSLHTSFLQKVKNVYLSVVGGATFGGSFDYLIFPWVIGKLNHESQIAWKALEASQPTTPLGKVARYVAKPVLAVLIAILFIVHFIVNLVARHITAAAITVVLSPFIALAHRITQIVREDKEEKITAKIRVIPVTNKREIVGDTATILQAFLAKEKIPATKMEVVRERNICFLRVGSQRFAFLNERNQLIKGDDPMMVELAAATSRKVRRAIFINEQNSAIACRP